MARSRIFSRIAVAAIILSLAGVTRAEHEEGAAGEWEKGACKADVQKLCASTQPGEGRIHDCMKQHEAELSAGCKSNMSMMKEKKKERKEALHAACKPDHDQYCKDITPGEGREMACLHAHSDKLSAGCKEAMKSMRHHRMKRKGMQRKHGENAPPEGSMPAK